MDVGETAPAFEATTTEGKRFRLSDFTERQRSGHFLILYFFPKPFTPGCTNEARRFRDNHEDIEALGGIVVGVSVDDHGVQCDFSRANHLTFPLIADSDGSISRAFDVVRGFLPFNKRVTFIIDSRGVIVARFHHEAQVARHIDDVVSFLRAAAVGPVA